METKLSEFMLLSILSFWILLRILLKFAGFNSNNFRVLHYPK